MASATRTPKRFVIRGRVQGVGFRWFVQRAAVKLGIAGWVRNREDGSVEVMASGPPAKVAKMRGLLWQGPSYSRVDGVEESEGDSIRWEEFRIVP